MPRVYSRREGAETPPADAVYVGRPGPYGNPFIVGRDGSQRDVVDLFRKWIRQPIMETRRASIRRELAGKDLVCWCKSPGESTPCHADVLLEIANS